MIPLDVIAESREKTREAMSEGRPTNWAAAAVIIALWLLLAAMTIALIVRVIKSG